MYTTTTMQQETYAAITGWLGVIVVLISLLGPAASLFAADSELRIAPGIQADNPATHNGTDTDTDTATDTVSMLVSVGTHRLHIRCQGQGSPVVIVDTGLGAISLEWNHIQKAVATHTRICLYDRAGYGQSDPGPVPRTSSLIVDELYRMLINGNIEGPYLLVGHSFGGYNMQLFASRYRELVAGAILVDSSHRDQYKRFLAPPINVKTSPPNKERLGVVRFTAPPIHPNLPPEIRDTVRRALLKTSMRYAAAYEFYNFQKSAAEVREGNYFPNIPLLVLTRGKRVYPRDHRGDLMEKLWMQLQSELTYLSHYSGHVIAHDSGHFIHLDQPRLVIDSIEFLVDVIRFRSINRNYSVETRLALEPDRYDFYDATWRSNRLYYDSMLGHTFPGMGGEGRDSLYLTTTGIH